MEYLVRAAAMMESEEAVVPQFNSMVPQYHPNVTIHHHHPYHQFQPAVHLSHPAAAYR